MNNGPYKNYDYSKTTYQNNQQQPQQPRPIYYNQPATMQKPKTLQKRNFTTAEIIFAWICFFAGYSFFRSFAGGIFHPLGGLILSVTLFCITAVTLKLKGAKLSGLSITTLIVATVISFSFILLSNHNMQMFVAIYLIVLYMYFIYSANENYIESGFSDFMVIDFLKAIFVLPFYSFADVFRSAFYKKNEKRGKFVLKIFIGLLIAIIPAGTICTLLSYDERFTQLIRSIFNFNISTLISHIGSLICGIPVAMYIFGAFISSSDNKCKGIINADECRRTSQQSKIASSVTVLASVIPILFIYVIFFISQWQNYVSGFKGVLPDEYTYANYARAGFFQLCTVSVINLVILIAIALFMKRNSKASEIILKVLSVIISIFTLILISTAISKMVLYIDRYGLTPKRVYASLLMIMLALLFVFIILKQTIVKIKLIPTAAAIFTVGFALISLSGTDSFIAKYNADRYLNGTLKSIDVLAMEELGDSSIPQLVRVAKAMDAEQGSDISKVTETDLSDDLYSQIARSLYYSAEKIDDGKIFSLTVPRIRALNALKESGIFANSAFRESGDYDYKEIEDIWM